MVAITSPVRVLLSCSDSAGLWRQYWVCSAAFADGVIDPLELTLPITSLLTAAGVVSVTIEAFDLA